MEDMHQILETVHCSSAGSFLATIVHVEGSAYKKEGSCMFLKRDGSRIGTLSAGCLEEDLAARASEGGNTAISIDYDMRSNEAFSWGEGAGCNGTIRVLLEPADDHFYYHLYRLKALLDMGKSVLMVKKMPSVKKDYEYLYITEDQEIFGSWNSPVPPECKAWASDPSKRIFSGMRVLSDPMDDYFIHQIDPKPRIFLYGAGPDAIPIVSVLSSIGFDVTVADWRPALCTKANFPDAKRVVVGFPHEIMEDLHFNSKDFVLLLTHNFKRDRQLLSCLVDKELRYLGVLGSVKRTARLLGLREVPGHIATPVGLPIGAEGPEEIAVSIAAELIQIMRRQPEQKVMGI
ncbi:XdhC family protein [Mesobacillus foraminis]|uniref:XdhC family protein n=1 Tax=Mesobacillus foraminis TaxID=279826 RepID=UPI001BEBDBF6|nr:XdhC/CoxI family protein [Mesobacillus foraminis]MBT2754531.1 XdhC family protein [Mesobacillus foraminis]